MKRLTTLALKRPLLMVVIFFILIFFGFFSYSKLNYNLLPNMDFPVLSVVTTYRGASAQEIENNVSKNIEDAVANLEGVKKITTSSMEGTSVVTVQFKNGTDIDKALTDAQRKINQETPQLPDGIEVPVINKFSSSDLPIMRMSVTALEDEKELYDILDQQIKPQLANINGVGNVTLIGGNERQVEVNINRSRLKYYGLSIAQVNNVVRAASLSMPAGNIKTLKDEYAIEFDSKFTGANQLRNLVVKVAPDGGKVFLKDVASVVNGQTDYTTLNHFNGIPSIGIQIQKQTDANAVEVSKLVKEEIKNLELAYGNISLNFDIASDQSTYTLKSANSVMEDLMLAILIVSIVMLFFLHTLRNAAFVLVALPASIIPTFIGMYLFGMSLNMMTLMAMSLVVGILVDDSIVILENIMRHMEMGKNKRKATVDARNEIGFTAMAITLVDIVVFLPMSMVDGMIGNILREFSLTVVFSTLMSLIVCFTLTPLLASRYGKLPNLKRKGLWAKMNRGFEGILDNIKSSYTLFLKWSLTHKRWIFLSTIALFVGAILLPSFGFIGSAFVSNGDQSEFVVNLELDPSSSLYKTNQTVQKAEAIILKDSNVISVFSNVGVAGNAMLSSNSNNAAQLDVKLVDPDKRGLSDMEIGNQIQNKISKIPGVKVTVSPISFVGGGADQAPIQLVIKGSNRKLVRQAADSVMALVKAVPGVIYPQFSTKNPKPEIKIKLNREKMAELDLSAQKVGTILGTSFRGNNQAKYKYNGQEYDIMVQSNANFKTNIKDVENLVFVNADGQHFTLNQFAEIHETMGESILERNDRLPSITVNANIQGRPVGTVGAEISEQMNEISMPKGVSWGYTGQMENQGDAFGSLFGAFGIGILLVYLIMVALYENAIYPLVVMMAMPLAIIGALLALALTMNEMTIFSIIGMIMLIGLVTKNGILLVDFTNQRKAEGASLTEALIDAGKERFRPILMTTIAMITGMLPMALATGAGSEITNGMAWVLIGGLSSSLIMTLVVVPCVYYVVDKVLNRFRSKKRKRKVIKVQKRKALAEAVLN